MVLPVERDEQVDTVNIPSPRVVLHVDLDAFFVQVERSLNPTLIGKPMAVHQHADIIAVSYEARKMGVTKHMPVGVIRQQYPSVKLVHVQTVGPRSDKVSYRNYRQAARSIFTLIRAFCPSEGGGNNRAGAFHKTSVDEAYLEPGRRTLEAELALSQQGQKDTDPPKLISGSFRMGVKRSHAGIPPNMRRVGAAGDVAGSMTPPGTMNGEKRNEFTASPNCESGDSQSQWGVDRDEEELCVATGVSSGEGVTEYVGNRRGTGGDYKHTEEESDRWLEAGGLLGVRIQRKVREVLQYDCSVGIAGNKFLAKLATNLAKPKGVRVLCHRDVPCVLASTPAIKIPGCGAGSVAARQFAQWGATSVLDLRRVGAAELRDRLGDHLGAKVYDRCRGIDNDPVEPSPEPSRVSSQVSLVPLIKPAYCHGKPGEKLTPVYPWEVARLRAHIETLVDDLVDRMKEELDERNRRPTRLCLEYHLHKRGSKSQTFSLPPLPPRARSSPLGDALYAPTPTSAPVDGAVDIVGLPPVATLVELALTPFKGYLRADPIGGGQELAESHSCSPPVVKLNVAFLGFEKIGNRLAAVKAAAPQQHTLESMMWLERDFTAVAMTDRDNITNDGVGGAYGNTISTAVKLVPAATEPVISPSAANMSATATSSPATERPQVFRPMETACPPLNHSEEKREVPQLKANTILVRCPRCKSCLPLGQGWDRHQEEHSAFERKARLQTEATHETRSTCESSSPRPMRQRRVGKERQRTLSSPSISLDAEVRTRKDSSLIKFSKRDRSESDVGGSPKRMSNELVVLGGERNGHERTELSELLCVVVTPDQAANALKMYGFLNVDGQTRFANLFRHVGQKCIDE